MAQTYVASTQANPESDHDQAHRDFRTLFIGSIGVVYGDIGTSPLYAFKEAVNEAKNHGVANTDAVLGILSLIAWTLLLIVTLKYVLVLLRADNRGEGGTFALMALGQSVAKRSTRLLFLLGIGGAALFYGDAIITPAISVLSAVEGLKTVAPQTERIVLPLALVILIGLFAVQSRGTERVAKYFGPITLVWFILLAIGGLLHIFDDPRVFYALTPYYAVKFVVTNGMLAFIIMGLVFLAVTGAEALYADLGHFGRRPIEAAWLVLVLPCLLLNYFGQAALLLSDPSTIDNPFLKLYP
ncbi:MAG: KUP/HAK/KT family potassium transporter, partial [Hyphomicrobiales bacterium]|nr:KUP/HAK/KT family potassium transporter [Hyphomicrobiales bacterium]